jgi:hypothetical protein
MTILLNNSYSIDPDYAYLFNGLNFIRGESFSIVHVDHPGTPLQVLIGLFIFIISSLRGADDLTTDVLSHPQLYIKIIIISISFCYSLVLFFIGKRFFKHQNNLTNALLLQLSFLFFAAVTITPTKLFTETIIPLGSLLIILITVEKAWGKMNDLVYAILSGIILGIFIAVKITFLPIAIIPLIIIAKWRNRIFSVVLTGLIFFLSILPVMERFGLFQSFIQKIATHEGKYGSGEPETINVLKLLNNFWNTLQIEYTFTLIITLSLIILIIAFRKNKFQFLRNNDLRVLFAIFLGFILQLILVSRHAGFRYMIPALLFAALALTIAVNQLKSYKIARYSIIFLVLLFAGWHNLKMLSKEIKLNHRQNETYSFVEKNINPDDPLLVITKESWFGSPFKTHSIMFGKCYSYRQGEQYNEVVKTLYPNQYFWAHNQQQFADWEMAVMPDLVLTEHKFIYVYIQTDNPQLYRKAIDDFSKYLKFYSKNAIDLKLVYSNPALDEEIYLIQTKGSVSVFPKLSVSSGFELRSEEDANRLLSTHDSITFDEGWRLVEDQSFEGRYSVQINPDNPFGITAAIPNLQKNDFLRISVMCRRSSVRNECVIGIKSFLPDEDFVSLGSVSTETLGEWEKIEYAYRFNHVPSGQKINMFIWNNGNEPMYFDDLRIDLY